MKMVKELIKSSVPLSVISRSQGGVLLYHSVSNLLPDALSQNIDNVSPEKIWEQLSTLQQYFKFVPIDEFGEAKDKRGLMSVTFDDGYSSVIKEGLPIFQDLNIPISIFINTSTLEGHTFWRDKIRYVINQNLDQEFLKDYPLDHAPPDLNLYKASKHYQNNSKTIDKNLEEFFTRKDIHTKKNKLCFSKKAELIDHPLITYGNHGHSHYVLSSLSHEEQREEIIKAHRFLDNISNIKRSKYFSVPFGGNQDYNDNTLKICRELGYKGVLLSRNRLCQKSQMKYLDLKIVNRLMPTEEKINKRLAPLYLKSLMGSFL